MTVTQEKPHRVTSVPPPAQIMQVVFGYMQARAFYVVA